MIIAARSESALVTEMSGIPSGIAQATIVSSFLVRPEQEQGGTTLTSATGQRRGASGRRARRALQRRGCDRWTIGVAIAYTELERIVIAEVAAAKAKRGR